MSKGHDHPAGGPNDGGPDWFRVLDMAVWIAVFLIGAIAIEWLLGKLIRESIAKGASRHLAKVAGPDTPAP